MTENPTAEQREVAAALGVCAHVDIGAEAERRTAFLVDQLVGAGARTLVLAISGGVDSAAAGALCRAAARRARARFVAVRLPYGEQRDADDAQLVLDTVDPDGIHTVDVAPASDAALASLLAGGVRFDSDRQQDFVLGNIKARQRMVAQYAISAAAGGLVVGTDHAAEAVTGFFTKYGDGGVDLVPLSGLTKRQVRALAEYLGIPDRIVHKVPTADLESLQPQLPDEDALGLTYTQIDDFLEGLPVDEHVHDAIVAMYRRTEHKRRQPAAPA